MAEDGPSKQDITTVFKRLRSIPTNKICFDCGTNNPTWSSVTYGVFICIDCSAVHRSLGVHITFVRSTQLDTTWTWLQLRAMQCGGNSNATAFFRQHNCTTTDAQQKYKSRAASLYREKLHHMAAAAMRNYGTELHLDTGHGDHSAPMSPEEKEVDFFKEHSDAALFSNASNDIPRNGQIIRNGAIPTNNNNNSDIGPSVEAALSTSPTHAQKTQEVRKSTIGTRKPPQNKKPGLGAKKGLGAQRVKTNFNDIEKEAQLADQRREEYEVNKKVQQKLTQEEEEKQMASVRLAYKDLSLQRQKQEEKMLKADPKKAEQFERLGMGFGGRSGVGHSVASEMKTIDQETPVNAKPSRLTEKSYERRNSFEDEFEFLGMTSGPPKYNDSPFSKLKEDSYSSYKSENSRGYTDEIDGRRSKKVNIPSTNNSDEAQKKFGNAKAISSDQYFGDSKEAAYERQSNLAKFQGSTSISSADYFGEPQRTSANRNYDFNAPNLSEIKDGVKDGVNRVAGRLSNIASGVMNSFQDRYGY